MKERDLTSMYPFHIDKQSFCEWKGLARDVGYEGHVDFYLMPNCKYVEKLGQGH